MRLILIIWGFPIVFFWGWYYLSLNDMHFGMFFLSKAFHDHLFGIYGNILHMNPADVPAALAWLFFVDTLIVVGLALVGKYRRFWLTPMIAFVKHHVLRIRPDEDELETAQEIVPERSYAERAYVNPPMAPATVTGPAHPAE